MGEFEIRRYRPADADRVRAIHEAALRASPIEFVEGAPADADLRNVEGVYRPGGAFLVGEVDGTAVATGGFLPAGGAAEIRRMRVHPDHQDNGYGAAMLAELERRIARRGIERAVLDTHADLRAARRLYESRGYREAGRERVHGHERVRYAKTL